MLITEPCEDIWLGTQGWRFLCVWSHDVRWKKKGCLPQGCLGSPREAHGMQGQATLTSKGQREIAEETKKAVRQLRSFSINLLLISKKKINNILAFNRPKEIGRKF